MLTRLCSGGLAACLLLSACGSRTPLPFGAHFDDDASEGAGGSSEHAAAGRAGSPGVEGHGGVAGASNGTGFAGASSGTGFAGASSGAGAGGAPSGNAGEPGVAGRADGGSGAETAGQGGGAGSNAGAGGDGGSAGEVVAPLLVASISQGEESACATVDHGPLKCWGDTFNGLLGNGYRIGPTLVPGLETGVRLVSVGTHAACALMDSGDVECFGMGYGSVTKVAGLPRDVTSVACASPYFDHTCVASPTAGVICWGANNFGQLGNGMTTPSFTYQFEHVNAVGLAIGATAVTAGSNDTCAITGGGALWCWGMNRYGELGTGTFDGSLTPAGVVDFSSGAAAVSAGEEYTCALTPQGTVRCWGWNATGQGNVASPIDVAGVSDATALSVGGGAGCAVTRSGALKCWGLAGWNQLGTGSAADTYTQAVDPLGMSHGVVAVGVGERGVCDVLETGAVYCWGNGPGGGVLLPKQLVGF